VVQPHLGPSPRREVLIPAFFNLSLVFPGLPNGGRSPSLEGSYPVSYTQLNWYPTNPRWFTTKEHKGKGRA
jgi:hypothetical protein